MGRAMGFGHSDPRLITFNGEKGRGSGIMHISLHMHRSPILSLYLLSWTFLPLFSLQSAPETSPGWEMSRLGEDQARNPEGIWAGMRTLGEAPGAAGGFMQKWGSSEVWGAHQSLGLPLP